ncbi:ArdC family protein [Persicobacter diffluens]|uniref:DNA primase n=1 Tax=Persicobacter diffluens TaxID=981 RepID=A0AAN4W3T4_9BACT|nr:DNA primase [Persicobacter diffluens]
MKAKAFEKITDQIIELLEQGVCPWKHYIAGGSQAPHNFSSKREYNGFNHMWLSFTRMHKDYKSCEWLTFKQAKELNGTIKKGSKGTTVIYYDFLFVDANGIKVNKELAVKKIPFIKTFTVFNMEQTEGIDWKPVEADEKETNVIESAERIINNMPNPPKFTFGGDGAYYRPSNDSVNVPKIQNCTSEAEYYGTFFHELIHATGHEKRLNRQEITEEVNFGSQVYSKEELTAELGAAYLCGEADISEQVIENQAAYLQGWLKALKNDKKMIFEAAAKATKAAKYIIGG